MACGVWNSVPNSSEIEQSAAELLRFEYLTLWPWTRVTCSAMLWDNFHKVETQSAYPFVKCNDILMLIRYVTLWPWPFTRWSWTFVVHQVSCDQSLYEIWAKSNRLQLSYWSFSNRAPPRQKYITGWSYANWTNHSGISPTPPQGPLNIGRRQCAKSSITSPGLFNFSRIWYIVLSRDTKCLTNVQG